MRAKQPYPMAPGRSGSFEELSDIRLCREVSAGALGDLPMGSRGTVVMVHGEGQAYSVEFAEAFHALLILAPDQVEAIPEATRGHFIAATDAAGHRPSQDHRLPAEQEPSGRRVQG